MHAIHQLFQMDLKLVNYEFEVCCCPSDVPESVPS